MTQKPQAIRPSPRPTAMTNEGVVVLLIAVLSEATIWPAETHSRTLDEPGVNRLPDANSNSTH